MMSNDLASNRAELFFLRVARGGPLWEAIVNCIHLF